MSREMAGYGRLLGVRASEILKNAKISLQDVQNKRRIASLKLCSVNEDGVQPASNEDKPLLRQLTLVEY